MMTNENSLDSRLLQLEQFEKSENYQDTINAFNRHYDPDVHSILEKWISNQSLSKTEIKYVDLYSKIQLSCVKYCVLNWLTEDNVQSMIEKLPGRLLGKNQLNILKRAIIFIREQQDSINKDVNGDIMLLYIMRMIDARSFAYPWFTGDDYTRPAKDFSEELHKFLQYETAKQYFHDMKSSHKAKQHTSLDYRHQFIMGCCTFDVARCPQYKGKLPTEGNHVKYVYILAKYVRILLKKTDFDHNKSLQYCVRGILTLLTNYISHEYWLNIMNQALADEKNEDLQEKNPFNIDLFSLIVHKILGSKTFQEKAQKSASNDESFLLDTTVVFLVHWSDTQSTPDDDDEQTQTNNSTFSVFNEPNQLLRLLNTHAEFHDRSQMIIPYIDAKYDRLRLFAISLLSNIMSAEDFSNLHKTQQCMAKDLIKLLFNFMEQAKKQSDGKFKGISFDKLLDYLLRFLIQDFIKEETVPYISQLVQYAQNHNILVLKILRRISTHLKLTDKLASNEDLRKFLDVDANDRYSDNLEFSRIIKAIRQNLAPPPPPPPPPSPSKPLKPLPTTTDNKTTSQAFISYCHRDKDTCADIHKELEKQELFGNIWIDKCYMKDDMFETIPKAIKQSKVVIVLLSDSYCNSDMCSREWKYALIEKIKVYVITIQADFDTHRLDWVKFAISDNLYYRLKDDDAIEKLIQHLKEFLNRKIEQEEVPPSKPSVDTSNKLLEVSINRDYLNKTPISTWTSADIQNWCNDNHLEKWCKLLIHFDGTSLTALYDDLSNDLRIPHILKGNNLDGFDIIRLRCEIKKLLEKQKAPNPKIVPKNYTRKRRVSKNSNK